MSDLLRPVNLDLAEEMKDREFRREWHRARLEISVPEQFRKLREHRRLTQESLAQKVGMKQSAIARFERSSDAKWKTETLLKLAEALGGRLSIRLHDDE